MEIWWEGYWHEDYETKVIWVFNRTRINDENEESLHRWGLL